MNVYLLVVDTLADWEIGFLAPELHSRRFFANPQMDFQFRRVGITDKPVTSMGGVAYTPDLALADLDLKQGDMLVLPGAEIWDQPEAKPALEFARDALDRGIDVAAICGATMGLAFVGALNDRPHTSNAPVFLEHVPGYEGKALYRNAPAVSEGNLITATGLAPLEFTYEVLKRLGVWRPATLDAWLDLFRTREERAFNALMESMQPA